MNRKRAYTHLTGSLQGALSSPKPEAEESSVPTSPAFTSGGDSSPRFSLDARRVHSETPLTSRRSLGTLARPVHSVAMLEAVPLAQISKHFSQRQAQLDRLGLHGNFGQGAPEGRSRRRSGDLSMAAHAELLANQVKDDATRGPVDEDSLTSNYGGSSNHWRSSNTSSSSQTHANIQRLTRLDTTAWQIAYDELTFSRVIGEGSFGRVFLGKWRETTVAIKLLTPPVPKAGGSSDSDNSGCALSGPRPHQACNAGSLDDLDKEAGIMAALRHPNVVMFLGVCLEPPCMVAEVSFLYFFLSQCHILLLCIL